MIVVIWSQENFHIGVKHEPAAYSRNRNVVARRNLGDRRDEFIALGRGSGEQHLHRSIHADHDMVHPRWHCLGSSRIVHGAIHRPWQAFIDQPLQSSARLFADELQ